MYLYLVFYLNAEAQRTQRVIKADVRLRRNLFIMHENEISEKIISAAIRSTSYFRARIFGICL